MKKEFTPNEWYQSHRPIPNDPDGMYNTQVYTEDGETICTLAWYPKPPVFEKVEGEKRKVIGSYREANAKLIAAAPNLLDALEEMLDVFSLDVDDEESENAVVKAQRAIQKALQ